jgi:hypothetical protein
MQPRTVLLAVMVATAGSACQTLNAPVYFAAPETLVVGGKDDMGMDRPAQMLGSVVLRFRRPNDAEQAKLDADSDALGFRVPWLQRDRLHMEVLYTIKNLDAETGTFNVHVNGATEYTRYDEAAVAAAFEAANENAVNLPLMLGGPKMLAAGATYQGIIREDDFSEAALDLDAMGRWMAPFAAVLINRSEVNPVGMEMVPANLVVPAMFQIDVTLSADKQMSCEFLVRVRDDDDRLYHDDSDPLFRPDPADFVPMIAAKM